MEYGEVKWMIIEMLQMLWFPQIKLNLSTKSIAMKSMEAIAMAFDISMACLNRRRIFIIRY